MDSENPSDEKEDSMSPNILNSSALNLEERLRRVIGPPIFTSRSAGPTDGSMRFIGRITLEIKNCYRIPYDRDFDEIKILYRESYEATDFKEKMKRLPKLIDTELMYKLLIGGCKWIMIPNNMECKDRYMGSYQMHILEFITLYSNRDIKILFNKFFPFQNFRIHRCMNFFAMIVSNGYNPQMLKNRKSRKDKKNADNVFDDLIERGEHRYPWMSPSKGVNLYFGVFKNYYPSFSHDRYEVAYEPECKEVDLRMVVRYNLVVVVNLSDYYDLLRIVRNEGDDEKNKEFMRKLDSGRYERFLYDMEMGNIINKILKDHLTNDIFPLVMAYVNPDGKELQC